MFDIECSSPFVFREEMETLQNLNGTGKSKVLSKKVDLPDSLEVLQASVCLRSGKLSDRMPCNSKATRIMSYI